MKKVQLIAWLTVLAVVGCETAPEESETRDAGRFGSSYEIVTNESPAAPDEPPALEGDSLFAMVTYSGGCNDHAFTLERETQSDTAQLWLHHRARGDDCEALIRERIRMPVPNDVLETETVLLLNPNSDVPFVLRWGGEDSVSR